MVCVLYISLLHYFTYIACLMSVTWAILQVHFLLKRHVVVYLNQVMRHEKGTLFITIAQILHSHHSLGPPMVSADNVAGGWEGD